jgi:tRNA threonylcarbamoyladenosine biosynthesis protein TsaE
MAGMSTTETAQGPWLLSEEELVGWGERVGATATAPLVIALRGDLGAGKTTLARAIARGAGVAGPIPSPTYNLLFRYPAARGVDVVHLDLYRLAAADEVWALGWSELPGEDDLLLVEWPERAEHLLPRPRWEVHLAAADDPGVREMTWRRVGDAPPLEPPVGT